jgi:hypothetical protein
MKPLHKLKKLSVSKVSLVPKGSNGEADVVFYRHDASVEQTTPPAAPATLPVEKETVMKEIKDMTQEELIAHAEELQRQLNEKPETPPAPPAKPEVTEEVLRALPAEVQAVLKASQDQVVALAAANEANTAVLRQLQEESETNRFTEIARREIPNLPGTDAEKATMLRGLKTLGDKQYDAQLAILKASSAAMAQIALAEIGSRTGEAPADSPMGELNNLARTIQTADPKLSHPQAFERACQQRPDLYKQTRTERFTIHRVA